MFDGVLIEIGRAVTKAMQQKLMRWICHVMNNEIILYYDVPWSGKCDYNIDYFLLNFCRISIWIQFEVLKQ